MTCYTPGPWTYDFALEPGHGSEFTVLGPHCAELAYVCADETRGVRGPMVEANARLIAVAPDLLEAVKSAHVQRDPRHRVSMLVNDWQRIEDAIAKAEGRPTS